MMVLDMTFWSFLALLGAIVPLLQLGGRSRFVRALSVLLLLAGSLAGLVVAGVCFWQNVPATLRLPSVAAFPISLTVDRLSAFFLFLICSVCLPVCIFSTSYVTHHYATEKARWMWALLSLFILSMIVVVTASTGLAFLVGWELMTIVSAGLILIEGDSEERIHDVYIYLLMMHAGAAAVVAAFFLYWPYAHGLEFDAIRSASVNLPAGMRTAIFLLAFVGFSTKAGIIPFHLWLPRAHPIAPSPVSALMSGVMLKTAIYGLVRFGFDFLHGGPRWSGYLVLAAGAVSGLLGVLYAIAEHDLKRLLAYHSVENIGIIYLGLGSSLLFLANGAPHWANLALIAALLHTLNHAFFKSLLFLGAGAISHSTHTLDLEELGGLLGRMPITGAAFLVGCCSIVGLPVFNGFISEWLTFRGFLYGSNLTNTAAQVALPLMMGVLALIGGLAAACFIKVYGVAFLGRPRSTEAENAAEAPLYMRLGMVLLALACILLGVFPLTVLSPLASLAQILVPGSTAPGEIYFISRVIPWVALTLLGALVVMRAVWRRQRVAAIWACGLPGLTSRMQYTSTAFSKPLRSVFVSVYKPDRTVSRLPTEQPYFANSISYRSQRTTSFEKFLYRPVVDAIVAAARQVGRLQTGNIQVYLLYIFLTLVSLLVCLRFLR
ncbi:MAG TPA: proton-conducting transporter membrane subunit [Terriglobia bacterium]|nr:proton-conducting transporter membrane subunit [Terriglobia bacterium]